MNFELDHEDDGDLTNAIQFIDIFSRSSEISNSFILASRDLFGDLNSNYIDFSLKVAKRCFVENKFRHVDIDVFREKCSKFRNDINEIDDISNDDIVEFKKTCSAIEFVMGTIQSFYFANHEYNEITLESVEHGYVSELEKIRNLFIDENGDIINSKPIEAQGNYRDVLKSVIQATGLYFKNNILYTPVFIDERTGEVLESDTKTTVDIFTGKCKNAVNTYAYTPITDGMDQEEEGARLSHQFIGILRYVLHHISEEHGDLVLKSCNDLTTSSKTIRSSLLIERNKTLHFDHHIFSYGNGVYDAKDNQFYYFKHEFDHVSFFHSSFEQILIEFAAGFGSKDTFDSAKEMFDPERVGLMYNSATIEELNNHSSHYKVEKDEWFHRDNDDFDGKNNSDIDKNSTDMNEFIQYGIIEILKYGANTMKLAYRVMYRIFRRYEALGVNPIRFIENIMETGIDICEKLMVICYPYEHMIGQSQSNNMFKEIFEKSMVEEGDRSKGFMVESSGVVQEICFNVLSFILEHEIANTEFCKGDSSHYNEEECRFDNNHEECKCYLNHEYRTCTPYTYSNFDYKTAKPRDDDGDTRDICECCDYILLYRNDIESIHILPVNNNILSYHVLEGNGTFVEKKNEFMTSNLKLAYKSVDSMASANESFRAECNDKFITRTLEKEKTWRHVPQKMNFIETGSKIDFQRSVMIELSCHIRSKNLEELNIDPEEHVHIYRKEYSAKYNTPAMALNFMSMSIPNEARRLFKILDAQDKPDIYQLYTYAFLGRLPTQVNEFDQSQKILYITGYGGTGKSTLGEVILNVIGKGQTLTLENENASGFLPKKAASTRLVAALDADDKFKFPQSVAKSMSSGESVSINSKNIDARTIDSWLAHMLILSNKWIGWSDDSGAIPRRLLIIRFTNEITVKKGNLKKDLNDNLADVHRIFNSCYHGVLLDVYKKGTTLLASIPPVLQKDSNDVLEQADPLRGLKTSCIVDIGKGKLQKFIGNSENNFISYIGDLEIDELEESQVKFVQSKCRLLLHSQFLTDQPFTFDNGISLSASELERAKILFSPSAPEKYTNAIGKEKYRIKYCQPIGSVSENGIMNIYKKFCETKRYPIQKNKSEEDIKNVVGTNTTSFQSFGSDLRGGWYFPKKMFHIGKIIKFIQMDDTN